MKKIIALLLAAILMLSLAACAESKPETTEETSETVAPTETTTEEPTEATTEPSVGTNDDTLGQTLRAAFLNAMDANPEATTLEIAETLIGNPAIQFAPVTEPIVPGWGPGFAADIDDNNVDLPALGNPTNPTSASNFNSRITAFSMPGSPGCA